MSAELVVISWPSNQKGEQFGAVVKVCGEYFDAGSQSPKGRFVTRASIDHPLYQALKKSGVEQHSWHSEDDLRAALMAVGLGDEEIERKFQSAREHKINITVCQPV